MKVPSELEEAPPRKHVGALLDRARRRVRTGMIVVLLLVSFPAVLAEVLGAFHATPEYSAGGQRAAFYIFGAPFVLMIIRFIRQDVVIGRKLLTRGQLVEARAVRVHVLEYNNAALDVAYELGGEKHALRFRVPITVDQAHALVGDTVPLLVLTGRKRAVGIVLEGCGIVTTR